MKILIDECLPIKVKEMFDDYESYTVRDLKWTGIKNGILIKQAIEQNFNFFITADKNLSFQQNRIDYDISVIVLDILKNKLEYILPLKELIIECFKTVKPFEAVFISKDGIKKIN